MTFFNKSAVIASLAAFLLVCWTAGDAQQTYPSTGVEGFDTPKDDWAVSSPDVLDQQLGQDAAMSPDHWSGSASLDSSPQMSATNADNWDAEVDEHPWLKEFDGFDPKSEEVVETTSSEVEIIEAGSETEQPKVPLPPSAASEANTNSSNEFSPRKNGSTAKIVNNDVRESSSTEFIQEESKEKATPESEKADTKKVESTQDATSGIAKETDAAKGKSEAATSEAKSNNGAASGADNQAPPAAGQSDCGACTDMMAPVHINAHSGGDCQSCRIRQGRLRQRSRAARMWSDYQNPEEMCNSPQANHAFGPRRPMLPNRVSQNGFGPFQGGFGGPVQGPAPAMGPNFRPMQDRRLLQGWSNRFDRGSKWSSCSTDLGTCNTYDPQQGVGYTFEQRPARFGFFQTLFGQSRFGQPVLGQPRFARPRLGMVSNDPYRAGAFARMRGAMNRGQRGPFGAPMERMEQTVPNTPVQTQPQNEAVMRGYPVEAYQVGFAETQPRVPVPPSMKKTVPMRGGNQPMSESLASRPNFRPDLGHRDQAPVQRGQLPMDGGQQFGYEEEHFPPMSEIIASGRFFGSVNTNLFKPFFQNNTAIARSSGLTQSFDFDYEVAPELIMGFESKYGPGVELGYFQFDQNSEPNSFTSDGVVTGTTSVFSEGMNSWSRLTASAAGDLLTAEHSLEVHQLSAMFFKELKFRRSRLNGKFGMQYISIAQELEAELSNGGSQLGTLTNVTDFRAYGPKVAFEYYRPIGHTPLALVNNFGGSLLFGNRDQFVNNTWSGETNVVGADEITSILEIGFAIQSHRRMGESRSVFWRLGYETQAWIGGGTASNAQDDFGFRGLTFAVGFNR